MRPRTPAWDITRRGKFIIYMQVILHSDLLCPKSNAVCLIDTLNDDFFVIFRGKSCKNSRHTGWASRSRLLLVSYHVTSLIRLSLVACVCRSNLGNKRTRFTHSHHRMAYTLKHFCSYSSIGTDTRCCSNGAGFLLTLLLFAIVQSPSTSLVPL